MPAPDMTPVGEPGLVSTLTLISRSGRHCMVSQNSARKSSIQLSSSKVSIWVDSPRESCRTLLMMLLTRSAFLMMMSVSR